jgi:antiphage defense system Thoeris ThsB-like protein
VPDPRAFISFDFDHDEIQRMLFVGQSKNSATPFVIEDWSSKSQLPEWQWESLIKDKIRRCHLVIVLVGRHMATASSVAKELQFAVDANVPSFGVYVDDAGSTSGLPVGLQRNRVITWTWSGVASAIRQMMTEGKNRA